MAPLAPSSTSPSEQDAEATKRLDDLDTVLTGDTITQIQLNPNSPKSRTIINEFQTVLNPKNVRSMSRGPNAKKNRKLLGHIANKLEKKTLDSTLDSAKTKMATDAIDRLRLKTLETIISSFEGELWSPVVQHRDSLDTLNGIRKNFSEMEPVSRLLADTGSSLSAEKLDEAAASETPQSSDASPTSEAPTTYSFSATSESALEAPREIRDFKSGDRLDLSAIQKQLGTPLQMVEQLPQKKGEMQILRSDNANTSVIAIADAPGKPPFVLKVFGDVRQRNIVT